MPWLLYLQGMVTLITTVRFRAGLDVVVPRNISCPTAGIKTTAVPVYPRQLTVNFLSTYDIKENAVELLTEVIFDSDIKPRKILNGQNFNPEVSKLGGSVKLKLCAVVQH